MTSRVLAARRPSAAPSLIQFARACLLLVAALLFGLGCGNSGGDADPAMDPTSGPLRFEVDESIVLASNEVPGLNPGDPPRPVGAVAHPEGIVSEFVLDELIVASASPSAVDALVERYGGEILEASEETETDAEGLLEYLVRVDLALAPEASLVDALLAMEPEHQGEQRVNDERVLALLAILAYETTEHGLEVSLNGVERATGIEEGTSIEAPNLESTPRNAFAWPYMRAGSAQDIGVSVAWQLLEAHERLGNKVKIMIVDGGFSPNLDFPETAKIRQADWGDERWDWHGTQVTVTAMGTLDNEYGTAGPAAPVGELIAVGVQSTSWKTLRRTKQMVDEERPDIVNMSFGKNVGFGKRAARRRANRHLGKMVEDGALIFASAGNDGLNLDTETCIAGVCGENILTLPCESEHVVCVGGMGHDTPTRHGNSNFGTKANAESVEIWGPYRTVALEEPDRFQNPNAKWVTGTSFASPFVAGVAALVKAADPNLSAPQIFDVLVASAHEGVGLLSGHQRRINAFDAVDQALGGVYAGPDVVIEDPNLGQIFSEGQDIELIGTATDFAGRALPITWEIDGDIVHEGTSSHYIFGGLAPGSYTIRATATDIAGTIGTTQISIDVETSPPDVYILSPSSDSVLWESQPVELIGKSEDPDNAYALLPDNQVRWEVRRTNGTLAAEADGHQAQVSLAPGSYDVYFIAENGAQMEQTLVNIDVLELGDDAPPTANITSPSNGSVLTTGPGTPVTVNLNGSGSDTEDGSLAGVRFRWLARDENGVQTVLCEGSNFEGDGGITIPNDCSMQSVEFDPTTGLLGGASFSVILQVKDSAGQIGQDQVQVTVQVNVP